MTANAVAGYLAVGGGKLWNIKGDYDAGSVGHWAEGSNEFWNAFDANLAAQPGVESLWWQLCTFGGSERDGFEAAQAVLEGFRSRLPGVTIYVSAQPEYVPVGSCNLAGANGPSFMAEVASQLAAQPGVSAGPLTGPLSTSETADGCHANAAGQAEMGQQLLSFFG